MSLGRKLSDYILASNKPFDWTVWHCCTFVSKWVLLNTNFDPMQGLQPINSKTSAHRLILKLGGSLEAAWTKQLKKQPIKPALAFIGDIVVVEKGDTQAVGICAGRNVAVLSEHGIVYVPIENGIAAWRLA